MPEYDFRTLSPMDFELLIRDLLREKLGIELKAFAHGPDGGVDLRSMDNGERTVVQCKHYSSSTFSQLKSAAKEEKTKMDKVRPDNYYFATSQNLSYTQQQTLVQELTPHLADVDNIFAMLDVNKLLDQFPNVERDHFKLWMASASIIRQIVLSGIWQRSEALMEEIQDRVRLYVKTPSFTNANLMLSSRNVCVITGAPGVGKSMLADMLALSYWQDGWQIVELGSHEISKAWDAWESDARQFFYFDDVFGQTDIRERLSNDNGITVARLINRVGLDNNKKLVITTRTHVLNEAEVRDEPVARAGLHARECVVEVTEYGAVHRARVLYNHLYFSALPRDTIKQFANSNFYRRIINHPNFTPRLIELTIRQQGHAGSAHELLGRMLHALDHPIDLWGPSFTEALTEVARTILLHLVSFPPVGADLYSLQSASIRNATPVEYQQALDQLKGSWINVVATGSGNGSLVSFHNPSCRDFVLSFIDSYPAYALQILQNSTDTLQLARFLRYGTTIGRGSEIKYPGLKSAITKDAATIAQIVINSWEAESEKITPFAAEVLDTFRTSSDEYGFGLHDWVLAQILKLSHRIGDEPASAHSAAEGLACALMEAGRLPSTPEEFASCKYLFFEWCETVGPPEDWDGVFGFLEWLLEAGDVPFTPAEESRLHEVFKEWLRSEFDNILFNAENGEDARSWVDDLKKAEETHFGGGSFDEIFAKFEQEIVEKYEAYEPTAEEIEDMRAAAAIESSTTSVVSLELGDETADDEDEQFLGFEPPAYMTEDSQIRSLFNQLG
ncbi:restriction endonuclease [Mycobacterium malmoense]|uniref:restriction endonuclease n=1 Tax=Mycobacterium malmoense TaxID=1780 RepID=UPI000AADCEF6|nr:restriction endonuclease [Mycobacterium malmoense]